MSRAKIVLLNWNGCDHLARFLPGVVAAAPAGVGVVVADNGSTDDSVDFVRRTFPGVELVCLDRNYGFAGGYDRALAQVEAEYYVLLNTDVETPPGWLEPLLAALDADPTVGAVAPKLRAVADRGRFEYAGAAGGFIDFLGFPFCRGRILQCVERDAGQYDTAREVFWASGAAFCCRAELFRRLGGFAEGFFAHMEEIDLCWRMQLAGYRVRVEPSSCVYHVGGGTLHNDSPQKLYLNYRNNLAMLMRCAPSLQRVAAALLRPLTDGAAALVYLLTGRGAQARAVVRAWRDFVRMHGRLARERRAIRRDVRREAAGIYHGSIVLRYMTGRKTFDKLM